MISVFDTNIIIDYLAGVEQAAGEIDACSDRAISRISWMEVLVGVADKDTEAHVRSFLSEFTIIELSSAIAERAILVRRENRLKMPDAIIYATVLETQGELITRNTRDFPASLARVRVPYHL